LDTELILFAGIFSGLFDALAWLLDPNNWWVILQVALGLGFVIFVHELGHFLVAKACGVKCEKFYIGFDIGGVKLFKKQWGETEYGIGILPLGGYVKMLGQDDNPYRAADEMKRARMQEAAADPSAAHHHLPGGDLPPEPVAEPHPPYDPRSYMAQTVPERMAIISAGVIMNVIFAFIMATCAYLIGVKELPCRVSQVFAGGAAWEAGLETGDEVVQIGEDLRNPIYDDLRSRVTLSDREEGVEFVIRREGEEDTFSRTLHPKNDLGVPQIGVDGPRKLELHKVPALKYSSADRAYPDLLTGDRLLKINGVEVETVKQWQRELVRLASEPLELEVLPMPNAGSNESGPVAPPLNASATEPEPQKVVVPPSPRHDLGLVMEMGPIAAIQQDSPAAHAGLERNDVLLSIDGEPVGDPMTLGDRLATRGEGREKVSLRIKRGNEEKELTAELRPVTWIEEIGPNTGRVSVPALGIAYQVFANVQAVEPEGPADRAGLRKGDVLTAAQLVVPAGFLAANSELRQPEAIPLDGDKSANWPFFVEGLQLQHPRGKVRLTVLRDGNEYSAELEPRQSDKFFSPDRGIVLALDYREREIAGIGEAARLGLRKTTDSLLMVYRFLQRLSETQISPKLLGGPVTIAKVAGQSAEEGFAALLMFLTMLSANLAVVNFLPIPVLDGGHMVFLIYEGIMGKPPSERVFVLLSYLGLAFILTLMLFVLGLDFGFISRR
jgi:regulator of sigma E protease